jgi:hypothetical protein
MHDETTAAISPFAFVALMLLLKKEGVGTVYPTIEETAAALTLLQTDAREGRAAAWATEGAAVKPSATALHRTMVKRREERWAGCTARWEKVRSVMGSLIRWLSPRLGYRGGTFLAA